MKKIKLLLVLIVLLVGSIFTPVYTKTRCEDKTSSIKDYNTFAYYLNSASQYVENHQYELAIENLKKALEYNPNDKEISEHIAELYYNLGRSYSDKQEYNVAIENYKKALEYNADYKTYTNLATIYMKKGDWDNARDYLLKAIDITPNNDVAYIYINLGSVYDQKKQYDLAIEAFENAKKITPNNPVIYNGIGVVYIHKKEKQLAIESFKKALAINPNYDLANFNLKNINDDSDIVIDRINTVKAKSP